jgi:hypothetical protein
MIAQDGGLGSMMNKGGGQHDKRGKNADSRHKLDPIFDKLYVVLVTDYQYQPSHISDQLIRY